MRDFGWKVNVDLWNLFIAIVSLGLKYQVRIVTLASTVFKKSTLHMTFEFNWPSDFRGDVWKCWQMDDRQTDARVTGILLAHPWAFGSSELIYRTLFCDSYEINQYGITSKILNTFPFPFSNNMSAIRARIYKMLVRIANREDHDQTASYSEAAWSWSALVIYAFFAGN